MLGVMDSDVLCDLTEMVLEGRAKEALETARQIGLDGVSYGQAVRDWASLMHRIAILQRVPDALTDSDSALARIRTLASSMTSEEVQLDYQILLQARADMAQAPDEYAGFTMAILRMLAFKPAGFAPGGKVALPARVALGCRIIQLHYAASDREVVALVQESPYLQYFLGFESFTDAVPFSSRTVARFRARIPDKAVRPAVRLLRSFQ